MMSRFPADGRWVHHFGGNFYVECPRCSKRAVVRAPTEVQREARLTCAKCGHSASVVPEHSEVYSRRPQDFRPGEVVIGAAVDWYFHEPLWLIAPCAGHELWAYNEKHLVFIKDYVSADLRESYRDAEYGYSNKSLASRLPTWIKLAKNRDAVLAAVSRLAARLA